MRFLLILALGLQVPMPNPGHGPYANQPGVKCYRGETRDLTRGPVKKIVHCECKLHCNEHGQQVEANDCMTFCDNAHTQCLCHTDETCEGK